MSAPLALFFLSTLALIVAAVFTKERLLRSLYIGLAATCLLIVFFRLGLTTLGF